jgi:hypothetical protein
MIVRVTGTLTTAKIITFGSAGSAPYSKLYLVDNSATGGIVTFKAYGQTGVSVAVGEKALVFYNGTDIVKVATTTSGPGDVVGPASATANGIALFNSTTGKLIKDSAASDGLIYGLTVGRGNGAVATNTAVGASALAAVTGGFNTAFGQAAGSKITSGTETTAIGQGSMSNGAAVTGDYNTAVGTSSLYNLTSGSSNTALGKSALQSNTTASNSTAVGYLAGTSATGTTNSFFGDRAGQNLTTGTNNTGIGAYTINGASGSGTYNVAVGQGAMNGNTSGSSNVSVGSQALQANTSASYNTALGYQAGYTNITGAGSTYLGYSAGYSATGASNTFVGAGAGDAITSGAKNSIIGRYNGNQNSLDIRTASNYIVLSDGDGNPRMYNNGTDWYDAAGKLRAIPQSGSAKTSSYTLATTDVGEYIQVGASGAIVVPDATFATGDVVSIFNNTSGNITMTMSITTAYIGGTDADKATITLATRGVATVLFISGTVCVVNGNVS